MKFLDFFNGKKTKKIALTAILTALSTCLAFASFPVFPQASFLKMDFADITLFITGMVCGPIYGLAATLISCTLQDLIIAHSPYSSGILMHFLITGLTMLFISLIYRYYVKKHMINKLDENISYKKNFRISIKYIILAFIVGAITWFSLALILNLTITPKIYGMTAKQVINTLLSVIISFNVLKYVLNFILTALIIIRAHKSIYKQSKEIYLEKNTVLKTQEKINM